MNHRPEREPRRQLVTAIERYVHFVRGDLAGEEPLSPEEKEGLRDLVAALDRGVVLPPPPVAVPIADRELLARRFGEVEVDVRPLLQDHSFYYLRVPITLVSTPKRRFSGVKVELAYDPGRPWAERPVTHDLFPRRRWKTLLETRLSLVLGLGADLGFDLWEAAGGALVGAMVEELAGVSAGARAGAEADCTIQVGPGSSYRLRRPAVLNHGRENVFAHWHFSDAAEFEGDEELFVAVILRTRRGASRARIVPLVKANFDGARLREFFRRLLDSLKDGSSRLRQIFGAEAEVKVNTFEEEIANGWEVVEPQGVDIVWEIDLPRQ